MISIAPTHPCPHCHGLMDMDNVIRTPTCRVVTYYCAHCDEEVQKRVSLDAPLYA